MGLEKFLGKYVENQEVKKEFALVINNYAGSNNIKEIQEFFQKIVKYDEGAIPKILNGVKEYIDKNIFVDYINSLDHVFSIDSNLLGEAIDVIGNYKSNFRESKLIINVINEIEKPKELKIFLDIFGNIDINLISPVDLEDYINQFKLFPPSTLRYELQKSGLYKVNK